MRRAGKNAGVVGIFGIEVRTTDLSTVSDEESDRVLGVVETELESLLPHLTTLLPGYNLRTVI